MACFVVPATEAAIVTVINLALQRRSGKGGSTERPAACRHLSSLARLLSGGALLLAFEHLWHGEIQFAYPFLTAASSPEAMAEVYREMSTVGVAMALVTTAAWGVVTYAKSRIQARPADEAVGPAIR